MFFPLTSSLLEPFLSVFHGIFPRQGGVSQPPYESLNTSFGVGDDPKDVATNRKIIKHCLGIKTLVSGQQVHGNNICIIEENPVYDIELAGFDAFVTTIPGIGLMIQQADCQAVMLYDPDHLVAANVHCGWRGSVQNIIGSTINKMTDRFATVPSRLVAVISPSLGSCCAEFIHYEKELPLPFWNFQVKPNYFDFKAISKYQLTEAGVRPDRISIMDICTVCNPNWFSYRREKITGRFCSIIGIKDSVSKE